MASLSELLFGASATPKQRPGSLSQAMQRVTGMDPNAQRLSMLPYPQGALQGQEGPVDWTDWTAPQWLYDTAKAAVLPGHAAQGGPFTEQDVRDMAMATAGMGGAAGFGMAPRGAFAMGGARKGADLPMDEASRMARAREMGFDTPVFHGTTSEFDSFSNIGGGNARGEGHYFTTLPETASMYALDDLGTMRIAPKGNASPNVIPSVIRGENIFDESKILSRDELRKIDDILASGPKYDGLGLYGDWKSGEFAKTFDRSYPPTGENVLQMIGKHANNLLKEAGYSGRRGRPVAGGSSGQDIVVFDPKNIRSRFAAFDPSKTDSADLLAANASPSLSALMTAPRPRRMTEEERQFYRSGGI